MGGAEFQHGWQILGAHRAGAGGPYAKPGFIQR
jgi:hypothetical protein